MIAITRGRSLFCAALGRLGFIWGSRGLCLMLGCGNIRFARLKECAAGLTSFCQRTSLLQVGGKMVLNAN